MKKILLLALFFLPILASAQNDRIFNLAAFTDGMKLGTNTITFSSDGKLLVNGSPITSAQTAAIGQALFGNNSPITSGAVYTSIQQTILRLSNRMDSISNVLTVFVKKASADSALAAIARAGIDPNDLIANSVMNQWVDSKLAGTYFAPTAISFGTITANSIQPVLAPVTGATSYTLWKNGSNIATLLPGNLTYTDANLTPGTAYSYSATATDGSKISMPVTASATTLAATVDNSVASAGYTVLGYFNFATSGPLDQRASITNNTTTINANDYNTSLLSVTNGRLVSNNLYYLSVAQNVNYDASKNYKITFYDQVADQNISMYGNSSKFEQQGNNAVLNFSGYGNNSNVALFMNGAVLNMSAFKLEVQN